MKRPYYITRGICALAAAAMLAGLCSCAPKAETPQPRRAARGMTRVFVGSGLGKEYVVKHDTSTCLKFKNREDMIRIWGIDEMVDGYCETTTYVERMCDHE